ncbi:hypothetical protein [Acinetobacter sp. Ac_5812]|uniref:hypothetical protein n=1 Tax=Acinetobacter sp. Ac_5812 TaxID=1848937 RepID=UPI00148F71DD|nr:hypothetical protein [Acinetobacter sp. Ac_5812]NNP70963.1 hypothetical protein [Acinetobacter sp. Ac_5812]
MNIHINRPRYAAKDCYRFECLDCKKKTFALAFFQHWHGWHTTCLNCGRQYDDGQWVTLEFCRGIRKQNKDWAKNTWRSLVGVTKTIDMKGVC